jgi:hypothetical protein
VRAVRCHARAISEFGSASLSRAFIKCNTPSYPRRIIQCSIPSYPRRAPIVENGVYITLDECQDFRRFAAAWATLPVNRLPEAVINARSPSAVRRQPASAV